MTLQFSSTNNPIVDYLKVSPKAIAQIRQILNKRQQPCEGIRVGVRTRGCSGLSYTIEYALKDQNISKFDDVVLCYEDKNSNPIQIFIDPKVSMFLIGSEMIYKSDELNSGFDFVNPNEKGRCGCGESFQV